MKTRPILAAIVALAATLSLVPTPVVLAQEEREDSPDITVTHHKLEGIATPRRRGEAGFGLSEDGKSCYVADDVNGVVWVVSCADGSIARKAKTGGKPSWVAARDGHVFVYMADSEELVALDAKTLERKTAFPVGGRMVGLTTRRGGPPRVYASVQGGDRMMQRQAPQVRVFDSEKLREIDSLTVHVKKQERGFDREQTVEDMERQLEYAEQSLAQSLERRDQSSPRAFDERIRDLEEAVALSGLNATAREVLERELELTRERRKRAFDQMDNLERRIDEARARIKETRAKIEAKKNPVKKAGPTGKKIVELDIKFGAKGAQRRYSGLLHNLTISADGRYFFAKVDGRQSTKFLVEGDKLIPMESALTTGNTGWAFQAGFLEAPGVDGEHYEMNSYSPADLEYRIAVHKTGAYPRAGAHDRTYPFFYGHDYDDKLHIFNEWTGQRLEKVTLTKRGDDERGFFPLPSPGRVLVALESGVYYVKVSVRKGAFTPSWKITTLPNVIARVGEKWSYEPALKDRKLPATYKLENGPDGLKLDARTGKMSWRPGQKHVGRHRALLRIISKNASDPEIRQPIVVHVVP